jgi:hypothetical protein
VEAIKDPVVKSFWQHEFSKYVYQAKGEALVPIQNKLGAFLTSPMIRNIVGQPGSAIDLREVMDKGKILLVNVSTGRIGEDASSFLGSLIVARLQLAAMSRIDAPEAERRDFYLYADEFQRMVVTDAFEGILSEAKKYRLCLTIAHQYLDQLDEKLKAAVFGNVGTVIAFPIGPVNGESLEKQFYPEFNRRDLTEHDKYHIYVKLAIDGKTSKPFSATSLSPFFRFEPANQSKAIIKFSRETFSIKEKVKREGSLEGAGRQGSLL